MKKIIITSVIAGIAAVGVFGGLYYWATHKESKEEA